MHDSTMSESNPQSDCAAIVLAAGASTRLGEAKQLLRLNGESLLHHTVKLAANVGCRPIFTILGFDAERMRQELCGLETRILPNPDWQSGMSSSLHCGIHVLMKETPLPPRVLLLVCDQIRLSERILLDLLRESTRMNSPITASSYAGRLGVPAVFHRQLYSDLLKVEGDQGARSVIQQHLNQTAAVDFPEGSVDIDTPQDLASLKTVSRP